MNQSLVRHLDLDSVFRAAAVLLIWAGFGGAIVDPLDAAEDENAARPNVVLVMTDDQGYGDLACHGNTQIKTPNLDRLYADSVRLTDFHVDPTCSPTRAALMTGRYSSRTGVWHTIMGRSLMRANEVTLADLFRAAGYRTGIFGKWHLGDNYPLRPQDRGFDEVLVHGGGGVGQTPDYWGNDYFDDTYFHNGTPHHYAGYCTDVWFDAALQFIEAHRDRPFFAYIPTNAPHGPYLVAEKYSQPYHDMGIPSPRAEFYGMITNADENVARLRAKLHELDLEDNTILIFMTDNGTAAGKRDPGGYNAGMRGTKGSQFEGGHRVPCFFHYPAGGLVGGRDVEQLAAHVDILPTLAKLCDIESGQPLPIDGKSLARLLQQGEEVAWPERTLFVHSQRIEHPEKWRRSAVMTERWRLVDGNQLYDIQADPGQKTNVAAKHADVVSRLRKQYDAWWEGLSIRFDEYVRLELGASPANPTNLTCHDWHAPIDQVPWNQNLIERDAPANGFWAVEIQQPGRYEFTLRCRPAEAEVEHPLGAVAARVQVGDQEATEKIEATAASALVSLDLPAGPARMQTWLEGEDSSSRGAYYVEVRRVE